MKKILFLVAIMLCCATAIFAQNNRISYQAVVRDTANRLVANKTVTVTVNIFNGDAQTAAYSETHTNVQTNYNGLFSLQMGNGTNQSGDWNDIHWKNARVTTAVSLDGTELATLEMPLTAVPYALYAEYADDVDPLAIATQLHDSANNVRGEMNTQVNNLDTKINNLANSVDTAKTNIRGEIGAKADTNKVYTRTVIDNKLATKANADDVYTKSETYNKTEVNTMINGIKGGVNTLRDSVKTNIQNIETNAQNITALKNRVNFFNTHICDTVNDCLTTALADGTSAINQAIDTIAENIASNYLTTNGYVTSTQLDNRHYLTSDSTVITNLRSEVNTLANSHFVNNATCSEIDFCGLVNKLNNLETTVGGLNSTISGMQNTIDELNNTISGMQTTIDNLNNTVAGMQHNISDLWAQNEDLAQRISEMEELEHVIDLSTLTSDTTIKDGSKVTGTLSGNHKVTIAAGANVTLDGVNINGNGNLSGDHAGITCAGDATIILAHGSTNIVKGFNENAPDVDYPGIHVPVGNTLTIEGSGSLDARSNGHAAGIGGGLGLDCGNIRIVEGTVTAKGGAGAAGIGGGENGKCGAITITEGVDIVTASKGTTAPNSVGAGKNATSCGKVTIGDVEYWDGLNHYENGGDNYLTQSTLVYHPIVTGVSLSSTSVEENVNGVFQLTATASPSDATVIWTVSSDKVALYSDAGCNTLLSTGAIVAGPVYVKALAAGTATIKVTSSDKTAECAVTVISNNDPVTIASTFGYCYDCQRNPPYPTSGGGSCTFSGFSNPYVGNRSTTGPWKLEYKGSYESNDNPYNIYLDDYKSTYNIQSVPIFELFQWDGTSFQHAAYGVVCAYSNVTGNVDHTAFFEANNHYGCYLTGASHSSSLSLIFDEYMSSGLNSLIPNNTLSYITVSKGSTDLSSDKLLYYIPGDTYAEALARNENKLAGDLGWGHWVEGSSYISVYYKEVSNQSWDLYIDNDYDFYTGHGSCSITLDSQVDPNHTYRFGDSQ